MCLSRVYDKERKAEFIRGCEFPLKAYKVFATDIDGNVTGAYYSTLFYKFKEGENIDTKRRFFGKYLRCQRDGYNGMRYPKGFHCFLNRGIAEASLSELQWKIVGRIEEIIIEKPEDILAVGWQGGYSKAIVVKRFFRQNDKYREKEMIENDSKPSGNDGVLEVFNAAVGGLLRDIGIWHKDIADYLRTENSEENNQNRTIETEKQG